MLRTLRRGLRDSVVINNERINVSTNPKQLERIVAYLDGELSAEESAQVEQLLASDEQFRQELQGAERAWSALDKLPMPQVGDEFANTTMEMVVDAAREDVEAQTIALPIQKRKRNTTNALLVAMTLLLAALVVRVISQNPNRLLLADLPVIQHVDLYSQFESVSFLRDLHSQLGDDVDSYTLNADRLAEQLEEFELIADSDQREQWVESLDEDRKLSLKSKFDRFRREFSEEKQNSLRTKHQEIESDDNRIQLLQTMYAYEQWLGELSSGQQAGLRELEPAERIARASRDMRRAAKSKPFELTSEQLDEMFNEVRPFIQKVLEENKSEFVEQMTRRTRQGRRSFNPDEQRRRIQQSILFVMRNSPDDFLEFIDTVSKALPVEMREEFLALSRWEKQETIALWIRQYHSQPESNRRPGQISEQELAEFFVEVLNPEEKAELLALSRDEMQRRLERMYLFKNPNQSPEGPRDFREGPRRGPFPDGRGPRGRGDEGRQGLPGGPPPRGERGRRPEFEDGPGRPPEGFDGPPARRRQREFDDRQGPPRRRGPQGPPRDGPLRDGQFRGDPEGDRPPRGNRPPAESPPPEDQSSEREE